MLRINRLDVAEARILLEGARARAQAIRVPMCIAITDESGVLIAFERMDGCKVTSVSLAIDKSYTASAARRATHVYAEASQPGGGSWGINTALGGRLIMVGGGLPVMIDGEVVGGIGVSSGTPAQDQEVAQAGIDLLALSAGPSARLDI